MSNCQYALIILKYCSHLIITFNNNNHNCFCLFKWPNSVFFFSRQSVLREIAVTWALGKKTSCYWFGNSMNNNNNKFNSRPTPLPPINPTTTTSTTTTLYYFSFWSLRPESCYLTGSYPIIIHTLNPLYRINFIVYFWRFYIFFITSFLPRRS